MSKIDDGGSAFSVFGHDANCVNFCCYGTQQGMTYRQWLAGLAMQALLSAHDQEGVWTGDSANLEKVVIEHVDALIAALKETK